MFTKFYQFEHLTSALFIIYLLAYSIGTTNYIDHMVFIPLRAQEIGLSAKEGSQLISLIGITDLVSRICSGLICDHPRIHRGYVMGTSLIFMGTVSVVVTIFPSGYSLILLCMVLGGVGGVYVSLLAVVLIDFLGKAKFSGAFGLVVMFQALSNTGWPSFLGKLHTKLFQQNLVSAPSSCYVLRPFSGYLKDASGSFDLTFYVAGSLMILAGCIMFFERCARRWDERKTEKPLKS